MDDVVDTDPSSPRGSLETARAALVQLREVLPTLTGGELAEAMSLVDAVKAEASACQVVITTEAAHRGEFASARRGVGSAHDWVREHAPSLRQGGAGQLAAFAQDVAHATPGGQWSTTGPFAGAYADPERPEGIVWARVVTGEVGIPLALTALSEVRRMVDLLRPEAVPTVTTAILDLGVQWGVVQAKKIRPRLLAAHGADGEFDDKQRRLRAGAHLSSPRILEGDLTGYSMFLTPEQSAILEAALGPLSAPAPNAETGERDLRPVGQRRAEALAAICAGHAATDAEGRAPAAAPTALHVRMTLEGLTRLLGGEPDSTANGCGTTIGSVAAGTLLSPATMRQLACDADVIPVVLGSDGEVLDLGRAVRLFTRGQRRALWHRDTGCTWAGCTAPPDWAKAHHIVHWADGGRSDLSNAALLCQRHHTQVHDQRLIATVHPPDEHGRSVTWDLTHGSYDRELPHRLTEQRRERQRHRVRLDTGGPDPWLSAGADDPDVADRLLAWHDAFDWEDAQHCRDWHDADVDVRAA
ncbi:HNH endonuclease signature motif containing protein [Knoellia aerolata]|uniref:HNH nuclease n=1 Tax=Knoellia aerolata DSM 18566 TaxID=1385519 RepID=A0A0A0JW13_9MICO|nr:HNH endonuclease signature motif containing protein [Knoellia aerolata]KGN40282.1 HNH nuclease [Knoellia aerolata DSM 18566]